MLNFYFPLNNFKIHLLNVSKDLNEVLKGIFLIFSFPKFIIFHILKQIRKAKENRVLEKEGELCIWDPIDMVSFK